VSRQTALRFDDFYHLLQDLHCLQSVPFIITYTDPEGDLLPINNDENFAVALSLAQPVLRLHIQHKGQFTLLINVFCEFLSMLQCAVNNCLVLASIISLWCVHSPRLTDRRFSQFFCVILLQTDGVSLMLNTVRKFFLRCHSYTVLRRLNQRSVCKNLRLCRYRLEQSSLICMH